MSKRKILLVDDDVDLLESNKLLIENNNFEVKTLINTKLCFDIIETFKPDLIVLDVMMDTKLEGYNCLKKLLDDGLNVPVIIYSGMAESYGVNMRSVIDRLPKAKFIDKTEGFEELLKTINEFLK